MNYSSPIGRILEVAMSEKTSVFLEDVHLGVSPDTGKVYMGTMKGESEWDQKVNCSSEFMGCVLNWAPPGYVRDIKTTDGRFFRVVAVEVKPEAAPEEGNSPILDMDGKQFGGA